MHGARTKCNESIPVNRYLTPPNLFEMAFGGAGRRELSGDGNGETKSRYLGSSRHRDRAVDASALEGFTELRAQFAFAVIRVAE